MVAVRGIQSLLVFVIIRKMVGLDKMILVDTSENNQANIYIISLGEVRFV